MKKHLILNLKSDYLKLCFQSTHLGVPIASQIDLDCLGMYLVNTLEI